jgi:hypothetical protein
MKVYSLDIDVGMEILLPIYLKLDILYGFYKGARFLKRHLLNELERSESEKIVLGPYSLFCEGVIRLGDKVIDRTRGK